MIAHLIRECLTEALEDSSAGNVPVNTHEVLLTAVMDALAQLQGTYGLVVLFRDCPDVMIAARLGSPLVVGVGDGEHFVASDASPLAGYTDKIVYLADHELAVVTAESLRVIAPRPGPRPPQRSNCSTSRPATSTWAAIPTTCSRRSSSSPSRCENAMRGRLDRRRRHGRVRRPEPHAAAAAPRQPHHPDRLRHELARRPWWAST